MNEKWNDWEGIEREGIRRFCKKKENIEPSCVGVKDEVVQLLRTLPFRDDIVEQGVLDV